MIHLFRKVRLENLKDSRVRKYLLYAFGEIILVVVGILLALQFNNWNIEKENQKKEEWYLINIVEDIEYQKADLKDQEETHSDIIAIAKNILKQYSHNKTFEGIDSLNHKLNA